jgi:hypothetical protein
MKSLIVAVCSWPLTELYWNITARYEFPFFVTVVALLVWLATVKVDREPVRISGEVGLRLPDVAQIVPWVEQARGFARQVAKIHGTVSINDVYAGVASGQLPAAPDRNLWSAIFSKGFVDTGERVAAVTTAARKKGRRVNVWRLAT